MIVPTLHTTNLTLRGHMPADFEPLAEFYADELRSPGFGGPLSRDDAWRWFALSVGHWQLRGFGFWTVVETAREHVIGTVGLWNPEGWPEPELGWVMFAAGEGKGYAFEAAMAARSYAYGTLGMGALTSNILPGNTRSIRLAERLGAHLEHKVHNAHMGGIVMVYRHPSPEMGA